MKEKKKLNNIELFTEHTITFFKTKIDIFLYDFNYWL